VELIAAAREAERERLRLTAKAETEKVAAVSLAEAQRIAAKAEADAEMIRAEAAAQRYAVDAEGRRKANEADNMLTDGARASRIRHAILDHIEGIVRESVKPLEKIEGIKIVSVEGLGGNGEGAGGGGRRNVTDEVIDSALRYRVQGPMIDSLMKEIGLEGGLGRMSDVIRDAKDIDSIARGKDKGAKPKAVAKPSSAPADDRDDD
jgi:uncharacterized membrane protein YqiK